MAGLEFQGLHWQGKRNYLAELSSLRVLDAEKPPASL